ncbi:hypothetical protein P4261_28105 [Bacillus thuringiensis]|nr:hypothetical protein [Bacillus thuringiensis]MED2829746.1 hypothetical protein [Bacillus thuringiensis]MED2856393.1 hypothetical protein [Bacillus thuringiensis]MED2863802.1 hypothetical protein [Bacillus thuringiensis]
MFKKITKLTTVLGMAATLFTGCVYADEKEETVQRYEIGHIDEEKFIGVSEDPNDNVVIYLSEIDESLSVEHGEIIEVTYGQAHDDIKNVKKTNDARYDISDKAGIEL